MTPAKDNRALISRDARRRRTANNTLRMAWWMSSADVACMALALRHRSSNLREAKRRRIAISMLRMVWYVSVADVAYMTLA